MIDAKYFFKGFKSIKGVGSPAIALAASFVAIGALLKNQDDIRKLKESEAAKILATIQTEISLINRK